MNKQEELKKEVNYLFTYNIIQLIVVHSPIKPYDTEKELEFFTSQTGF